MGKVHVAVVSGPCSTAIYGMVGGSFSPPKWRGGWMREKRATAEEFLHKIF